jgi:DNA-binding NtrC family response regulator
MPWHPFMPAFTLDDVGGGGNEPSGRADRMVLILEREEPVRGLIRRILEADGHRVIEAGDVIEAATTISSLGRPVDLIIADLTEPGMCGPNGLTQRLFPATRVLLLALFSGDEVAPPHIREGAPVLRNPFREDALRDKVRELLEEG